LEVLIWRNWRVLAVAASAGAKDSVSEGIVLSLLQAANTTA
jgi:hypothetical protein